MLAVSAHFEAHLPTLTSGEAPATIHDFRGFPRVLHEMTYPAPGSPDLARRAATLLGQAGLEAALDPRRGLDHGAWVPLRLMYPDAAVPVVQLALVAGADARRHHRIGEALRSLREEGVLVLASGSTTHNLAGLRRDAVDAPAAEPVTAFAAWLAQRVAANDVEALLDWERSAPHARWNHPTPEHLLPFFVALGAVTPGRAGRRLHASASYGVLAMDAYAFP